VSHCGEVQLLIIVFSGYENFVSRFAPEGHEDCPTWTGKVGFPLSNWSWSGSPVEWPEAFIEAGSLSYRELVWMAGLSRTPKHRIMRLSYDVVGSHLDTSVPHRR